MHTVTSDRRASLASTIRNVLAQIEAEEFDEAVRQHKVDAAEPSAPERASRHAVEVFAAEFDRLMAAAAAK